jgi:hypothetical protein
VVSDNEVPCKIKQTRRFNTSLCSCPLSFANKVCFASRLVDSGHPYQSVLKGIPDSVKAPFVLLLNEFETQNGSKDLHCFADNYNGDSQKKWRMASFGMLRRVALVRIDVSQELSASIIRVTRICELGTMLAVTSKRRTLRRNTKHAACVGC